MDLNELILSLIENGAYLVALTFLFSQVDRRLHLRRRLKGFVLGVVFGLVAWVAMLVPLQWSQGVQFDGRSMVLALAGAFLGPIPTAVAFTIMATVRIFLGGPGTLVGVLSTATAAIMGLGVHVWHRRGGNPFTAPRLLGFGIIVQIAVVSWFPLIPGLSFSDVVPIGVAMLSAFAPAIMIGGLMMNATLSQLAAHRRLEGLSHLVGHSPDILFIEEADNELIPMNPAAEKFLDSAGGGRRVIRREHLSSLATEEINVAFSSLKPGESWQGEVHASDEAETPVHYSLVMTRPHTPGRQELFTSFSLRDISEQMSARKALLESAVRYRELFSNAGDAVIAFDEDQRITLFNERAVNLFGYEAVDAIGKPVAMLVPDRYRGDLLGLYQPSGSESLMIRGAGPRVPGLRNNGEEFPIEVTVSQQTIAGQIEFTSIVRDVTDRVRAEDHATMTRQAKDEFITSISHELRTPLTEVVGLSRELTEHYGDFTDQETAEFLKIIADSSTDTGYILDDMIVFSRSEMGAIEVHADIVDLNAIAEAVLLRTRRSGREIPIISNGEPTASADALRVRQILRNLVTNAIAHGGDQITVEILSNHETSSIRVTDNGSGIPEGDREKIFDPYFHSSIETQPERMGLGLTISRTLARIMGGDVTYKYENNHSTFELSLPSARTNS